MTDSVFVGTANGEVLGQAYEGTVVDIQPRKRVKTMSLNLDGTWEEDEIDSEEAEELGFKPKKIKDSDSEEEEFQPWAWKNKPAEPVSKDTYEISSRPATAANDWTTNSVKPDIDRNDWSKTANDWTTNCVKPDIDRNDWSKAVNNDWSKGDNSWAGQKSKAWDDWKPAEKWKDWGSTDTNATETMVKPSALPDVPQSNPLPAAVEQSIPAVLDPNATRCIIMFPMFNAAMVDLVANPLFFNDVHADVHRECQKFGPVLQVWINPSSQGDVWVHFDDVESSAKCQSALNQRWFGGQQINVEFATEENWRRNVEDTMAQPLD